MTKEYTLKNLNLQDNAVEARLFLPSDLFYFDGHFDEISILPGIVQTHWAIELARKHLDIHGEFIGVDNIKFTRIIEPDQTVDLNVSYDAAKKFIEFTYDSGLGRHSSGKIRFG